MTIKTLTLRALFIAAVVGLGTSPHAAQQDGSDANSPKAQAVEKLALQIMETPAVKAAI
jgi:hypothetical protein